MHGTPLREALGIRPTSNLTGHCVVNDPGERREYALRRPLPGYFRDDLGTLHHGPLSLRVVPCRGGT